MIESFLSRDGTCPVQLMFALFNLNSYTSFVIVLQCLLLKSNLVYLNIFKGLTADAFGADVSLK